MTRSHRSIDRLRVARVAGASLLGAALALSPVAAQASTIYPPVDSCTSSPASVPAGGTLSFVCASGTFAANEPVTITVTGENGRDVAFAFFGPLGRAHADAMANYSDADLAVCLRFLQDVNSSLVAFDAGLRATE